MTDKTHNIKAFFTPDINHLNSKTSKFEFDFSLPDSELQEQY